MINIDNRKRFLAAALLVLYANSGFAAPFDTELHYRILHTEQSHEPIISRDTILFSYSAPPKTQMVSLAFEHEQYADLYTYQQNSHGVFILAHPVPEGLNKLRYRVIVDGLWTFDPHAETDFDSHGILVSSIDIPAVSQTPLPGAKRLPNGSVRFIYNGAPDSRVSLIGDFNQWDPFLLPMEESPVHPGFYSTTVNLPPTSRLYRFVVDGQEIVDPANQEMLVNGWGELASILPQ